MLELTPGGRLKGVESLERKFLESGEFGSIWRKLDW